MFRRAIEVGVGHLVAAGHERLEDRFGGWNAGDRQGPLRSAVISDVAADHLGLHRLADELVVLLGQLPGRLDGLAATGREEHPVEVARGVVSKALGQLDGPRVGIGPQREVGDLLELCHGGVGQLLPAVADLDGEQARQSVEVLVPPVVPDVGPVTLDDERHGVGAVAILEDRMAGEVHPQVIPGGLRIELPGAGVEVGAGFPDLGRVDRHRVPQL
ncbi:MAG: hypothetical protein BWY91_00975 [bacterium ADurb.BinA028]|nr:MAG: hypothetical protein BWY91_00975 [bacterium ADurb.BinA028]